MGVAGKSNIASSKRIVPFFMGSNVGTLYVHTYKELIKFYFLLNIEPNVQVSDTRGGDSSTEAGKQKDQN